MRRTLTAAACLTVAATAAAVLVCRLSGDLADTLDPFRRSAELDPRAADQIPAHLRRGAAKQRAAEDSLAGRLTLLEAAGRWRDLDAGLSGGERDSWRACAAGATDEERYCRQVLDRAAALAEGRPEGGAAVDRLRRQLDEALAAGNVRLPEPEPRCAP